MKPWARFTIILFAYGVALLHTAVPHHHEGTAGQNVSISRAGCRLAHSGGGGLLQLVFSTDLGYGHLEIFKKSAETQIKFSPAPSSLSAVFFSLALLSTPVSEYPRFNGFIDKVKKRLLLFSATQFRAPPLGV